VSLQRLNCKLAEARTERKRRSNGGNEPRRFGCTRGDRAREPQDRWVASGQQRALPPRLQRAARLLPPRARLPLWDPTVPGDRRARAQLGARAPASLRPRRMGGRLRAWVARHRGGQRRSAERRLRRTSPRRAVPGRPCEPAHELEPVSDQRVRDRPRRAPRRLDRDLPLRRLPGREWRAPRRHHASSSGAGLLEGPQAGPVATRVGAHDLG